MALGGGLPVPGEDKGDVVPTETEGGACRRLQLGKVPALWPHDVQPEASQFRIHAGGQKRRRSPSLTQRHDGQDRLESPGPAQKMSGGGLRRADGRLRHGPGQNTGFDDVACRGRCRMGVDVPDRAGIEARALQCQQ